MAEQKISLNLTPFTEKEEEFLRTQLDTFIPLTGTKTGILKLARNLETGIPLTRVRKALAASTTLRPVNDDETTALAGVILGATQGMFAPMTGHFRTNAGKLAAAEQNPGAVLLLVRCLEHAAALGHGPSCCQLGNILHDGNTVVGQEFDLAAAIYGTGARLGDDQSAVNLGYIWLYGRGSKGTDLARAFECFTRSMLINNNAEGCCKLGDMYANGQVPGVPADKNLGFMLYAQAYDLAGDDKVAAAHPAQHLADCIMERYERHQKGEDEDLNATEKSDGSQPYGFDPFSPEMVEIRKQIASLRSPLDEHPADRRGSSPFDKGMFKDTAFLGDDDSDEDNGDEWDDTDEADENGLDPLANPANALLLYTRAEIGYYAAHQQGLDYYDKLIAQAIDGQKKAREALTEMTRD